VNHLSDDELVLHYYGEDGPDIVAAERHLRACAQCARAYESIARSLNAVTAPEFVGAQDDIPALRQFILDRLREELPRSASRSMPIGETGATAFVWLVSVVYPFSLQALFSSARWAQENVAGIPLVALTMIWACAGPLFAVFALDCMAGGRGERASTRLLVAGALMAAISPTLFLFVSRVSVSLSLNLGSWPWYGVLTLGALLALFRWPSMFHTSPRYSYVHRLSALVLTIFVLAHVVNQALAFFSVPAYTAMRSVMQVASQHPATYALIVGAVAIQITTGAAIGMKNVRAGAFARNLQAVSGWYLAAFLLAHVFSPLLLSPPQVAADVAAPVSQFNLLATPRSSAQLPFLILGVATFLFHVGVYARLAALAYLAEASVRRLSYAGVAVATTVVVTIGLSLCGIHLIR
jgi:succinate dehydrogenase/fumarate reductase cytochrome b subunit